MSEIQENTEAKLAAYIDGELEGAERAEIEKLLELNPNYRRVLDQLRVTRDLLRGLPREPAPPELAEAFNGQLERSVLLEGVEKRGGASSIQRWPHWAAVAAIVLLTVGLGAVVYFVLPKGRPQLQVAQNAAPAAESQTGELREPAEDNADRGVAQRDASSTNFKAETEMKPGGENALGGTATASSGEAGPQSLALNILANPQVQELLTTPRSNSGFARGSGGPSERSGETLVVVVQAGDPRQIDREVTDYFNSNNIAWEPVPAGVQVALNSSLANRATASTPAADSIDSIYLARRLPHQQALDLSNALGHQAAARSDLTLRESTAAMANAAQQVSPGPQQQRTSNESLDRRQFAFWQSRSSPPGQEPGQEIDLKKSGGRSAAPQPPATQPSSDAASNVVDQGGHTTIESIALARRSLAASAPSTANTLGAAAPIPQAAPASRDSTPPSSPASEPSTAPADAPVDVLIVVQKTQMPARATTAPATQSAQTTDR